MAMPWQIIVAALAFVFTTRTLLFVLGLLAGGVLAVMHPEFAKWMNELARLWFMVQDYVIRTS